MGTIILILVAFFSGAFGLYVGFRVGAKAMLKLNLRSALKGEFPPEHLPARTRAWLEEEP